MTLASAANAALLYAAEAGGWASAAVLLRVYARWLPSQAGVLPQDLATQTQPERADARRISRLDQADYFHEMYHAGEGYLAATNELLSLHVSQASRRAAPLAPEVLDRLARIQRTHDALPRPPQVGRVIGLANRPTVTR
ncbi:MAG: hypothetical protein ACRDFW_13920 [bacterium]